VFRFWSFDELGLLVGGFERLQAEGLDDGKDGVGGLGPADGSALTVSL
jgi:hypothetical protein